MSTIESVPACVERSKATATAVPWRLGAMGLLWIGAYLPLVSAHARQLWLRPHYQFFPLVLLNIWHVMSGPGVEIGGRRLLVEEACSGIRSLFSVLAATRFFGLWVRRPPVRALCLVLSAVGWVLLGNIVRVVAMTTLNTS